MQTFHRNGTLRRTLGLVAAAGATVALAACGSSGSGNATALLQESFTGTHRIDSGRLAFTLTVTPSGSSTLKGPITLSFGGPFQSLGPGRLPQSAFDVAIRAMGSAGSLTITSTGTHGYVTFQGASYELPKATFQRLEQSFSQLGSSPGASGSGLLGKLGIQPQHWLVNPQVVGNEALGGVETTHIHAGINVAGLLQDFNTFLQRASSLGVSGANAFPGGISAASRSRIASEVRNPNFDVWTGTADKTIRRLEINLALPVSGQASTLLGGLRSAGFALVVQYADLNQPQTISAPAPLLPYSQFQSKLRVLLSSLRGSVSGALSGGSGASIPGSTTPTSPAAASNYQKYSACIQSAAGSLTKMQQCAPLLNGK